jgi:hypothetical protein
MIHSERARDKARQKKAEDIWLRVLAWILLGVSMGPLVFIGWDIWG